MESNPGETTTGQSIKNILTCRKIDLLMDGSAMDQEQLRKYKAKLRQLREHQLKEKARKLGKLKKKERPKGIDKRLEFLLSSGEWDSSVNNSGVNSNQQSGTLYEGLPMTTTLTVDIK